MACAASSCWLTLTLTLTPTQNGVRGFFTLTSLTMLIAYTTAICARSRRELGQLWMTTLLVLLVWLNDPLYIVSPLSS